MGAPTSRGLHLSAYMPQFKSRLYYSMYRLQKLLKKMPFNNILPQVQSRKMDAFLSSARFPKQSTSEIIVVHGMFLRSSRIKMMGNICDRQCFVDWHILRIVQELFGVDTHGWYVGKQVFPNRLPLTSKAFSSFFGNANVSSPYLLVSTYK